MGAHAVASLPRQCRRRVAERAGDLEMPTSSASTESPAGRPVQRTGQTLRPAFGADAALSRRCRRPAESSAGRSGQIPTRRGDRRSRRREPSDAKPQAIRVTSWPGLRMGQAMRSASGAHAGPSRRCRRRAESSAGRPGRIPTRRGDRRLRRHEPFEAKPQASRVTGSSTRPANGQGMRSAFGADACPSRQCRRRAE